MGFLKRIYRKVKRTFGKLARFAKSHWKTIVGLAVGAYPALVVARRLSPAISKAVTGYRAGKAFLRGEWRIPPEGSGDFERIRAAYARGDIPAAEAARRVTRISFFR